MEWVVSMDYLGFKMSCVDNNSYIDTITKDFNFKFNIFMGDFNGIKSKLKCNLFSTYCSSFYGSNLCDFKKLDYLEVQWRKAQRRIWSLSYRTHCSLVYNVCKLKPPKVVFLTRFIKYFLTNVASSNSVVEYIFRSSVNENSRMGNNLRYILHKLNFNNRYMSIDDLKYSEICKMIFDDWQSSFNENDFIISQHML